MAGFPVVYMMMTITAVACTTSGSAVESKSVAYNYNLSTLLNTLGFHDLSTLSLPNFTTTATIFAPTDASLRSCPDCNLPLLFLEHAVPGLYPFRLLSTLAFGTKIQTLSTLCLTLTKSSSRTLTLFVGGAEITRPDLFNDAGLIIHGIQGYLAHLSPLSCQIDRMTSLSFPPASLPTTTMLKQAMHRLRITHYTLLSLLIQQNINLLSHLNSITIFSLDDAQVFATGDQGHTFVSTFTFHIVPNRRLTALELISLPADSVLPTMLAGESLVVTAAGGGGSLSPMRINNVRVTRTNVVCNQGVAVHGIAAPLLPVHRAAMRWWPDRITSP